MVTDSADGKLKPAWHALPLLLAFLGLNALAEEREITSTARDRVAMAVTVYNDDLALVRERRRLDLPAGLVRLALREVAAQMKPETALLSAVSGPPLALIEQNFDFDLLTPQKLLDKYVGREVTVIRPHPTLDSERRETATVLAAGQGTVLRFADRIETGVPGRLAFGEVPVHLRDRPTLSVLLDAGGGRQEVELTYLTGGLFWKADYVAALSVDGKALDLSGWVTLNNRSGSDYAAAHLHLVAGNVNRVRARPYGDAMAAPMAMARAAPPPPREEALADYHLYTFARPTHLADNQIKQLALLSATNVPVRREYLLAGAEYYYRERYGLIGQKLKPAVYIEFDNRGGDLGRPLPAGVVRVYARDRQGAAQFVGEDRIEHTAKNEKVRLRLGEAFDITAERKQTTFRRVSDTSSEAAFRIELRNGKNEAVRVKVLEPLPGEWEIVQESHAHSRASARAAAWLIDIPAEGSQMLDYTVRVRW